MDIKISGERGQARISEFRHTAYRVIKIAHHVECLIPDRLANPGSNFQFHCRGKLLNLEGLTTNIFSRIRCQASVYVYSISDDNLKYLPVLKFNLESNGHRFEYSTLSGPELKYI